MSRFKNETVLNYTREQIFKVFQTLAKRDFKDFDEKKPVGASSLREVGAYATKVEQMLVQITGYKQNELYEITSQHGKTTFVSRYELFEVDAFKTKLVLIETEFNPESISSLNAIIASFFFKSRVKKRFAYLVKGIIDQIEVNGEIS